MVERHYEPRRVVSITEFSSKIIHLAVAIRLQFVNETAFNNYW
jgi:hypothetical protein